METILPKSIEAEEAVLGSCIIDPGATEEIKWLRPDAFFIERHRWIFEALLSLSREKQSIDYLTLTAELEQRGKLAAVGGQSQILGLVNKTPNSLSVKGYANIVLKMYVRRRLIEAAQTIARIANSDETEVSEVMAKADGAVREVFADAGMLLHRSADIAELTERGTAQAMDWQANKDKPRGARTEIDAIDAITYGGFRPKRLYMVCARPGLGKSVVVGQIALQLARNGRPALLFALEMEAEAVLHRMACFLGDTPGSAIEDGSATDDQYFRYHEAMGLISKMPLHIESMSGASPADLRAISADWDRKLGGLAAVIVDTANLVRGQGKDDYAKASYTALEMKDWAHESPYAVILANQLNRQVTNAKNKRPRMSDIRETGRWEEACDFIWGIHRPGYYDDTKDQEPAEFGVMKNRHGRQGWHKDLIWRGEIPAFYSAQSVTPEEAARLAAEAMAKSAQPKAAVRPFADAADDQMGFVLGRDDK